MKRIFSFVLLLSVLIMITGCSNPATGHESVTRNDTMSSYETYVEIKDSLAFMVDCLDEFTVLLTDLGNDSDLTTDEIEEYESTWKKLSNKADVLISELSSQEPSSEYREAWSNMVEFAKSMAEIARKLSNWDVDADGKYTSNECSDLLQSCIDGFDFANQNYFQPFYDQFLEIPEPSAEPGVTESVNTNSVNTNKVSNPFTNKYGTATTICTHTGCSNYIANSGDTNCCTEHSNQCLVCNAYIDEDAYWCVSCLAAAASPTCEECGKDATYSINGLTGETEYYCTTHYKEMKDLLEWMSGN